MTADIGMLTAFGAGLLSFLSPCILPLVPPYLCFLAGASLQELVDRPNRRLVRRAVLRALGWELIQPSASACVFFLGLGFPAQEDRDGTVVLALG